MMPDKPIALDAIVLPPKPALRRRWLRRIGYACLAAPIVLLIVYGGLYWWALAGRNAEIAKLRAAGEPVWFADLKPEPLDPKVNGAPALLAAFDAVIPLSEMTSKALEEVDNPPEKPTDWMAVMRRFTENQFVEAELKALLEGNLDYEVNDEAGGEAKVDAKADPPDAFADAPSATEPDQPSPNEMAADQELSDEDATNEEPFAKLPPAHELAKQRYEQAVKFARAEVEANAEAFALLDKALTFERFQFDCNYDARLPLMQDLEDGPSVYHLLALLRARVCVAAYDGRASEAVKSILQTAAVAKAISQWDSSRGVLGASHCARRVSTMLQTTLALADLSAADFARIDAALLDAEGTVRSRRLMQCLRCSLLTGIDNTAYISEVGGERDTPMRLWQALDLFVVLAEWKVLETTREILNGLDRGDEGLRDLEANEALVADNWAAPYAVARMHSIMLQDPIQITLLDVPTSLRAARVGLRADRYHARHGQFPASLAEFAETSDAKMMVDPRFGTGFGYRIADDGFVVYPLGADAVDNGGYDEGDVYRARVELYHDDQSLTLAPRLDHVEASGGFRVRYPKPPPESARPIESSH